MSKLGRQYLRNIKLNQNRDFGLYVFSAEIDEGLWDKPRFNLMSYLENSNDIENLKIDNALLRFKEYEGNFL